MEEITVTVLDPEDVASTDTLLEVLDSISDTLDELDDIGATESYITVDVEATEVTEVTE